MPISPLEATRRHHHVGLGDSVELDVYAAWELDQFAYDVAGSKDMVYSAGPTRESRCDKLISVARRPVELLAAYCFLPGLSGLYWDNRIVLLVFRPQTRETVQLVFIRTWDEKYVDRPEFRDLNGDGLPEIWLEQDRLGSGLDLAVFKFESGGWYRPILELPLRRHSGCYGFDSALQPRPSAAELPDLFWKVVARFDEDDPGCVPAVLPKQNWRDYVRDELQRLSGGALFRFDGQRYKAEEMPDGPAGWLSDGRSDPDQTAAGYLGAEGDLFWVSPEDGAMLGRLAFDVATRSDLRDQQIKGYEQARPSCEALLPIKEGRAIYGTNCGWTTTGLVYVSYHMVLEHRYDSTYQLALLRRRELYTDESNEFRDLDSDGQMELVVRSAASDGVRMTIFKRRPDGRFTPIFDEPIARPARTGWGNCRGYRGSLRFRARSAAMPDLLWSIEPRYVFSARGLCECDSDGKDDTAVESCHKQLREEMRQYRGDHQFEWDASRFQYSRVAGPQLIGGWFE